MHPFAIYLAAKDIQREHRSGAAGTRSTTFAAVDAVPIVEPEPVSRLARLAAIVRRRSIRPARQMTVRVGE